MAVKVGDYFLHQKGTLFQVIEILDENYCICFMRDYKDSKHIYGNWKQSIANLEGGVVYGVIKKLTPAEIILYGPSDLEVHKPE